MAMEQNQSEDSRGSLVPATDTRIYALRSLIFVPVVELTGTRLRTSCLYFLAVLVLALETARQARYIYIYLYTQSHARQVMPVTGYQPPCNARSSAFPTRPAPACSYCHRR